MTNTILLSPLSKEDFDLIIEALQEYHDKYETNADDWDAYNLLHKLKQDIEAY